MGAGRVQRKGALEREMTKQVGIVWRHEKAFLDVHLPDRLRGEMDFRNPYRHATGLGGKGMIGDNPLCKGAHAFRVSNPEGLEKRDVPSWKAISTVGGAYQLVHRDLILLAKYALSSQHGNANTAHATLG